MPVALQNWISESGSFKFGYFIGFYPLYTKLFHFHYLLISRLLLSISKILLEKVECQMVVIGL
jgi:hypothetical protein